MESEAHKSIKVNIDFGELKAEVPDLAAKSVKEQQIFLKSYLAEKYQGKGNTFDVMFNENHVQIIWGSPKNSLEADELNKEALSCARNKDLGKAVELWRRAIEMNPSDPDYHYNLGLALFEIKDYKKGLDRFLEAIRICPPYYRAYFVLGSIYSKMRQFDKAELYLKLGLQLQRNNVSGLINLGAVYSIEKKFDEAIRVFENAISFSPKEARAYLGLGKIYAVQDDYENANRCFKAVIKLDPDGKLGNIAKRSIRADVLDDAVEGDVENADELYAEGYEAYIKGDFEKAIKNYKRFLKARSHDADVWASLASCQLRVGNCTGAINAIEQAISIKSTKAAFYKQAALIYDACEKVVECSKAAHKAMELGKNDSITLTLLGKSFATLGKAQESIQYLSEAVKLNPNNINARFHLARVLKLLGQQEAAKQHFEEILWTKFQTPLKEMARDEMQSLL